MARDRLFAQRRRRRGGAVRWLVLLLLLPVIGFLRPFHHRVPAAVQSSAVTEVTYPSRAVPPPPALTAASAILIDADTGTILYQKDAHARRPMASTTKMMTAILTIEHMKSPNDVVTASKTAANTPYTGLYLREGEKVTIGDLLWGMLLRSANDSCVAAAEYVAGSEQKFVEMMNAKAQEMGLKDTHYMNPHGLNAQGHYSSAYDLAQIARYAMRLPLFEEIVGKQYHKINRSIQKQDEVVVNKNRLIHGPRRWVLADGVKTGYTRQAGHCLVASASTPDTHWRLIAVVLHAGDSWSESRELLEYGMKFYQHVLVAKQGTPVTTVRVVNGRVQKVPAIVAQNIALVTPRGANVEVHTDAKAGRVTAPLAAGAVLGKLVVRRGDTVVGESPLLAAAASPELPLLTRGYLFGGLAGLSALFLLAAGMWYGRKAAQSSGRRRRRFPA